MLLVAWKGSSATAWVDTLQSGGYTVLLEDTTGERAWRTAKERGIDCVIIDGQKKPSHGRQTGHALRDTAKTRNIPIIWTNLDVEDAPGVAMEVKPDVTLAAPTDASGALAALQSLIHEGVTHDGEDAHAHDASSADVTPPVAAAPKKAAAKKAPAKPAKKKAAAKKKAPKQAPNKVAKKPARAAKSAK